MDDIFRDMTIHGVVMRLINLIDNSADAGDYNLALSWLDDARILMNLAERLRDRI